MLVFHIPLQPEAAHEVWQETVRNAEEKVDSDLEEDLDDPDEFPLAEVDLTKEGRTYIGAYAEFMAHKQQHQLQQQAHKSVSQTGEESQRNNQNESTANDTETGKQPSAEREPSPEKELPPGQEPATKKIPAKQRSEANLPQGGSEKRTSRIGSEPPTSPRKKVHGTRGAAKFTADKEKPKKKRSVSNSDEDDGAHKKTKTSQGKSDKDKDSSNSDDEKNNKKKKDGKDDIK